MAKKNQQPFDEYHDIAQRLKEQRLNKKLTRQKVAQTIQLPVETIAELESLKTRAIPHSNIIGLYKRYADLLEVDIDDDIRVMQQNVTPGVLRTKPTKKQSKRTVVISRILTAIVVFFVLFALISYGLWQLFILINKPSLIIYEPTENSVVLEPEVAVHGSVAADSSLLINGEPAPVSDDGAFTVTLYLQEGYNRITFTVVNSFSRQHTETRTVFFENN